MPDQTITWRRVNPGDYDTLREIYREVVTWLWDVKGITDQWHRPVPGEEIQFLIDSGQAYLALVHGEPAGAVRLSGKHEIPWEDRQDRSLYVHSLAVRPKFSGLGVGRAMLQFTENLAREQGKEFVRLDCMAENPRLRQYYVNAEFHDLGQHPRHAWYALFEKKV